MGRGGPCEAQGRCDWTRVCGMCGRCGLGAWQPCTTRLRAGNNGCRGPAPADFAAAAGAGSAPAAVASITTSMVPMTSTALRENAVIPLAPKLLLSSSLALSFSPRTLCNTLAIQDASLASSLLALSGSPCGDAAKFRGGRSACLF